MDEDQRSWYCAGVSPSALSPSPFAFAVIVSSSDLPAAVLVDGGASAAAAACDRDGGRELMLCEHNPRS